ncbi:lectin [Kineosporia sp. NBRC 101677]|uniref:lectin n=1 Tax=Kineosporia sp. NBRC 101677 TaxID=3032197 RepID=UPI0033297BF9
MQRVAAAEPEEGAAKAASGAGDVVGKITVGYQGWFACTGDGAPINAWWHWAPDAQKTPSAANHGIKAWPDMSEYENAYETRFSALGNGKPATLFSSYDQQTVDVHFAWMAENGCHTAALQRFNPTGGEGPTRDAMTQKVRKAAEESGTKFYVMYDVTNWDDMATQLPQDWTAKMKAYTSSGAYAVQNGKPVVCIWGFGFDDDAHDWPAQDCLKVITWLQEQGCYVIGGVPTYWREGKNDSRAGFSDVYHAFDMISPWMVGRIGDAAASDWFYQNVNRADQADCEQHGIDYQPCVLPGDLSERQRAHGDFMWRQFYNLVRLGSAGLYVSMFDEYNEGNQIAKTTPTAATVPVGSGFLALDEDGTACSSDYYLRLTDDGGKMLRGEIALTDQRPTSPLVGAAPGGGDEPNRVVALRAKANDKFVTVTGNGLVASAATDGAAQKLVLIDLGGGNVALKVKASGKFVCAEDAGKVALTVDRDAIGGWETFALVENSDGTVSLRSGANGRYVCAENSGKEPLIPNRDAIGPWESFTLVEGS